jgi:hypothetical protein
MCGRSTLSRRESIIEEYFAVSNRVPANNAEFIKTHETRPKGMSAVRHTHREDGKRRQAQVLVPALRCDDKQIAHL